MANGSAALAADLRFGRIVERLSGGRDGGARARAGGESEGRESEGGAPSGRKPAEAGDTGGYGAAVAVCLRPDADGATEILLVERARRPGDPWSGHMAFPGGRVQAEDRDALDTALRETREEVGLAVPRSALVGWLEPQTSPRRTPGGAITIVACVADCRGLESEDLELNHEIAAADWVPLATLVDPGQRRDYEYPAMPGSRFDAIELVPERPYVWGLTFRFLEDFFERVS